mmetsp:Transcript_29770/g.46928  ORF Transcript_29770/g.46928 Transcript_29770/m.46928 type:complete len:92 (+) Transcript_29770:155-430(+)
MDERSTLHDTNVGREKTSASAKNLVVIYYDVTEEDIFLIYQHCYSSLFACYYSLFMFVVIGAYVSAVSIIYYSSENIIIFIYVKKYRRAHQ